MAFTDPFIRRPVLAIVVSALLLLVGLAALTRVPLREFPELEEAVITVTTVYPGASARTIQGFVTTPLQVNIAGAGGIDYLSATSDAGVSTIEVHVRLGESTDRVLTEIVAKVAQARDELPRGVEDPVIAAGSGGGALMYLAFTSEQMRPEQIYDYLRRAVQPEIATLAGVGKAAIFGSPPAMRIWLDPVRMAAYGVTSADVSEAVQRDNFISAAGATEGEKVRMEVDARTDLQSVADFEDLVLRQEGERRVRLADVASVELAAEDNQLRAYASGEPAVFMAIEATPDANPLAVSRAVRASLPRLRPALPADLHMRVDWDSTIAIDAALSEVARTLLEAALIVIAVIFLFLGSLRVVLVPLVAIPLSLVGVVALLLLLGFSLNLLTLLAMVIAIGLVVDDAIVVVENVHRHVEEGMTPLAAAFQGAREVALPVLAMTFTLAAVYAPIAFVGGLTGALFTEFALTLAGAVIVSGVVALTLSPVMASRVLRPAGEQGRFADWLDGGFAGATARYRRALDACLAHRGAVLLFAAGIIAALPALFAVSQQELAPPEDTGGVFFIATPPSYANLDYMDAALRGIVDLWQDMPGVMSSWQVIRTSGNFGGLTLRRWEERERSQQALQKQFQERLERIAGMEIFTFGGAPLPGAGEGPPLQFVIASTAAPEEVYRVGQEVLARARASGRFDYINQSLDFSRPRVEVRIDRERAARLGIAMRAIGETLAVMLGEAEVNRFTADERSYRVIPQAGRNFRLTDEELTKYYLRTASNRLVPLSTVISLEHGAQPNALTQHQQLNSTTIQGQLLPPNSLGSGLDFLERTLAEIAPPTFRGDFAGESRRLRQESGRFPVLFGLSLALIFLVLAAQFNSFRAALVVLVAVPLSLFGAIVPVALGVANLNIYTQIGLLTLIGLISKHGILIVEFANRQRERGLDHRRAVLEGAALRLRPILMTTFATVLGVLPLLLASGAGAGARFSIGLMIAAGMLVGTLFTLFVLPVFYLPAATHRERTAPQR